MKDLSLEEDVVTGYRGLDNEHQMQVELLRAFRRAVARGAEQTEVELIFERLLDFLKIHFSSEMMLMRLYQFPGYQDHVQDHDRTVDQLEDLRRAYLSGDGALTIETADALTAWLKSHMLTADRAFAGFLVRLGVGPG